MGLLHTATQAIQKQTTAYQGPDRAICHQRARTITSRLAHLLWLPRFDLVRPYHLRDVRPLGLGLVAGDGPTLSYSALEHFLGDLEALRVAAPLGDALARCYLQVWPVPPEGAFFYLDNRRKVRYSGYPTAAGKISATDRLQGATTQLFVHDGAGHGLHLHSGPADDHLTRTLLAMVEHLASLVGRERIRGVVADQEMRSVALFLALQAREMGFVTIGRTPTAEQEAAFAVEGLFLPYRRDEQSGEITHWVAQAHTPLRDQARGLCFQAEVTLLLDCRMGLPGRLIPILHDLRGQDLPVALPATVYVGRWEGQERVFRDMRRCQNLDAHYGQKKVPVANRVRERKREALRLKLQAQDKQLATAQRKVGEYAERLAELQREAQHKQAEGQNEVALLRRASQEASVAEQRQRLCCQAERAQAKQQVEQARWRERQHRLQVEQRAWQKKLAERQAEREKVAQALQRVPDGPLYDFDLEKDDLMTYLRMAGENAHRFVQEKYFAGTRLEKVDEATMVRLVYNQPGWIRRQGKYLYLLLQGYRDGDLQSAVAKACQEVNQAKVELPSGLQLRMEVAPEILDC